MSEVWRLENELALAQQRAEELTNLLRLARASAGCRPGDGSDQESLFDTAAPTLFG
jgi:hypothetical protein